MAVLFYLYQLTVESTNCFEFKFARVRLPADCDSIVLRSVQIEGYFGVEPISVHFQDDEFKEFCTIKETTHKSQW